MGLVRVVLNRKGVAELLKSEEIKSDLEARAHRIASAAGPEHEVEVFQGRTRTRVTVRTATPAAAVNEATSRTLTRAIDAGR